MCWSIKGRCNIFLAYYTETSVLFRAAQQLFFVFLWWIINGRKSCCACKLFPASDESNQMLSCLKRNNLWSTQVVKTGKIWILFAELAYDIFQAYSIHIIALLNLCVVHFSLGLCFGNYTMLCFVIERHPTNKIRKMNLHSISIYKLTSDVIYHIIEKMFDWVVS